MSNISKGTTTDLDILSDIEKEWPASFEHVLPVLLRRTAENTFVGYLKTESTEHYVEIDEFNKIRREIERWVTAISSPNDYLKKLSPATYELQKARDERTLTRTLRMLKFFDELLLATEGKHSSGWTSDIQELLSVSASKLNEAMTVVRNTHIKIYEKSEYYTSLALLLVVALAESQCEAFRPVFWEARSAARARDELQRKWGELEDGVLHAVLDIVTLLIRYQSAPGQYARKTGDEMFRKAVKEIVNKHDAKFIKAQELEDALTVIGVLEEARNHKLPLDQDSCQIGNLNINVGLDRKWDQQSVKDILQKIQEGGAGAKHTWGYASSLKKVEKEKLNSFKEFVEIHVKELVGKNGLEIEENEVAEFTFDRSQTEDLRELVAEYVKKVVDAPHQDKISIFNSSFEVRVVSVPDCFGKKPEYVVEVMLNDYVAAEKLLFKQQVNVDRFENSNAPTKHTAGDLFVHLFTHAKKLFQLEAWQLNDNQKFYFPFPLLHRMLDIVYRLCPETCMSIPITFNSDVRMFIRIPNGLQVNEHREIIVCIANYVSALILNRAMSIGFQSCDIGLDSIVDSSPNSLPDSQAAKNKQMNAEHWKQEVEEAFLLNAYNLLVERYLRDYNTEREHVQWLRTSRSTTIDPIPINKLIEELKDCVNNTANKSNDRHFFLGIDIGGTLTKFQFYEFSLGVDEFIPMGKSFRMLTLQKDPPEKSATEKNIQEMNSAERFAHRLIDTIKAYIKGDDGLKNCIEKNWVWAVGISWPGPVRDNRIAGTSRILCQFPPLTEKIKNNKIEDIMDLDMVKALKNVWKKREVWGNAIVPNENWICEEPFVAIVNDGSAEGMGVVANLVWNKNANAADGRLVVVKLGTGTAGAVFKDGRLDPSLTEWGKMLLDLAAHPKLLDVSPRPLSFPKGTANLYLSSKTMPILARKYAVGLFNLSDLDSLELGLLLEIFANRDINNRDVSPDGLQKLRDECGTRDFASRGLHEPIDVEVLRRIRETGEDAEPALFELIERQFRLIGKEALDKLNQEIKVSGNFRLRNLLEVSGDDVKDTFTSDNTRPASVTEKLHQAYGVCEKCAISMGNYLGDFIALLYDIYNMPTAIVGGGVLNGETGKLVLKQAAQRTQMYGLEFTDRGNGVLTLDTKDSIMSHANPPKHDLGTLGAAVFAASEFLFDLKQHGIDMIKKHLMKLTINQSVEISEKDVVFKDSPHDNIQLAKYALTKKNVSDFLMTYGADLNFYGSSAPKDDQLVFIQWVKEKA